MSGARKIVKPQGQDADEFELRVAQELVNIQVRRERVCSVCALWQHRRKVVLVSVW